MLHNRKVPKKFYAFLMIAVVFLTGIILLPQAEEKVKKMEQKTQTSWEDSISKSSRVETSNQQEKENQKTDSLGDKKKTVQETEGEMQKETGMIPETGEQLGGGFKGENVPATGAGADLDFDEYYWGGKRYTKCTAEYLTEDMEWRKFVTLEKNESMKETMGANYGPERLLESYLEQQGFSADRAVVLLDRYGGTSLGREEFYVEFDDEKGTLVTVIYYRAMDQHGCYMDVLPCQYTKQEVLQLKKEMEENKKYD